MITRKQASLYLASVIMAVLAAATTLSISFAMHVSALGHEPNGIAELSGPQMSDENVDLKALFDKAIEKELAAMLQSGDPAISDGLASDETNVPNSDVAEDGKDSSGTTDNTDDEMEDPSDEEEKDSTTATTTEEDDEDSEESSSSGYEAFQNCLAELSHSPTKEDVQDCSDLSYGGQDENENTSVESEDENDEGATDMNQEYEPRTVS